MKATTGTDLSRVQFGLLVDAVMDRLMSVAEANQRGRPAEFDLDDDIGTGDDLPVGTTLRDVTMELSRRCTNNSVAWILSGRGKENRTPRRGDEAPTPGAQP